MPAPFTKEAVNTTRFVALCCALDAVPLVLFYRPRDCVAPGAARRRLAVPVYRLDLRS